MNILQSFSKKVKVAALLFLVMTLVVLYAIRVDKKTRNMDEAITTVYEDRLQPALIIVYLSENLHAKRMLLENHLSEHASLSAPDLGSKLADYDERNDQLVADFEQTILTQNEAAVLKEFKSDLAANARMERAVLDRIDGKSRGVATALHSREGERVFRQGIQNLHILAQIQSETGRDVVRGSHREAAGVSVITSLMIAVAIISGILIQSLVQKVGFRDGESTRFHFNQN